MAKLGPLIRLIPLNPTELPAHPSLFSDPNANIIRPDLREFISAVLHEAWTFVEETIPQQFTSKGRKRSPPAPEEVELIACSYKRSDLAGVDWNAGPIKHRPVSSKYIDIEEHWFGRRSKHADAPASSGKPTYKDFDFGLRKLHSEHEKCYTPGIYEAHLVCTWADDIAATLHTGGPIPLSQASAAGGAAAEAGTFDDFTMEIREMCHQLPFPLGPRVFPVLVITAKGPHEDSMLDIQIPMKLDSTVGNVKYSNGKNVTTGIDAQQRKPVVPAIYTSVERCRKLSNENGAVEWLMVTASDAKGNLPMSVQKLGIAGAVLKDVGLFFKWIADEQKKGRKQDTISK